MTPRGLATGYGSIPTVLDVIENALGSRPTESELSDLSLGELHQLRERLIEFWEAQARSPEFEEGDADGYLVGTWVHGHWSEPTIRADLSDSLLYYSRLLVLDPLADFFGDRSTLPEMRGIRYRRRDGQYNTFHAGPQQWSSSNSFDAMQQSPRDAAAYFARVTSNIYRLEPLVRSGVLVLRSQWPILTARRHQLMTSVRHDIKSPAMQEVARLPRSATEALAVWDNLRGMQVVQNDGAGVLPTDEPWQTEPAFYYLAKTLAVADAAGCQYVPSTESDLDLLRAKVNSGLDVQHPGRLLGEVSRLILPSIDASIERAIEIRQSSENFQDWRSALDRLRRESSTQSEAELRDHVEDVLRPQIRAVKRETQSTSLRGSVRERVAELVISGIAGGGIAAATGEGFIGVGSTVATGAVAWTTRAYTQSGPTGADAVLAALIRKR